MTQDRFPMTIGGEEVLNEHHLLAYTENGEMMDSPLSVRFRNSLLGNTCRP